MAGAHSLRLQAAVVLLNHHPVQGREAHQPGPLGILIAWPKPRAGGSPLGTSTWHKLLEPPVLEKALPSGPGLPFLLKEGIDSTLADSFPRTWGWAKLGGWAPDVGAGESQGHMGSPIFPLHR